MKIPTLNILLTTFCFQRAVAHDDMAWVTLNAKLPLGLSDMSATYVPYFEGSKLTANAIIIAGGCSDPNGNSAVVADDGSIDFYCGDVTNRAFVFYPSTQRIAELPNMPSNRYRHSAALVGNKLYLIGGRTLEDNFVETISVYDPAQNSWSSFMDLPAAYLTSDQGSFGRENSMFIFGGYDGAYNARSNFLAIDVTSKGIVDYPDMIIARGDLQAVYYNSDGFDSAFTIGGFTNVDKYCEPMEEAEMFDFKTNKWTEIPPMKNARGDKSVAVLRGEVLVIGGESKHESLCSEGKSEVTSYSVAVDDVESFDPRLGSAAVWNEETDLPAHRFRSAAAVDPNLDAVYIFGGQMQYNANCECYATSSNIYAYRVIGNTSNGASDVKVATVLTVSILALFMLFV